MQHAISSVVVLEGEKREVAVRLDFRKDIHRAASSMRGSGGHSIFEELE